MNQPSTFPESLHPLLDDVRRVANYLWERGWAEFNAGNISVDVTDSVGRESLDFAAPIRPLTQSYPALAGRSFIVTATGHRFRDLALDACRNLCLLRLSDDGFGLRIYDDPCEVPRYGPTSEFPSHLRIHQHLRKTASVDRVVLHTHPSELVALSHFPDYQSQDAFNRAIWSIHPEVKVHLPRGIGLVPYTLPGSEALAAATVEVFRNGHDVALWQMHGCVAIGPDPFVAFDRIDTVNKAARMILMCLSAAHKPAGLSEDQLNELVAAFGLKE